MGLMAVPVVVAGVLAFGWLANLEPLSARSLSLYKPGDCVRTPIIEASTLERWEEPAPFAQLFMIAEVGDQHYRLREWGGRRGPGLQWYPGYVNEEIRFKVLDNRSEWQLVPCPEQGPDPDPQTSSDIGARFPGFISSVTINGNTTYYNNETGQQFTITR
jgi:hypothetical protein